MSRIPFGLALYGVAVVWSLRYNDLKRPSDSVVPPRFYVNQENLNLKQITILAEPNRRWRADIDMLIIVRSAANHFERRDAIRLTWGNTSLYDDSYKIELLYLVGKSGMATTDNMVLRESTEHKDVLLADYKDTYANLTIKDIIAFDYARQYQNKCKYLAIAGDEVMLDIPGILNKLVSGNSIKVSAEEREVSFCYEFPCCMPVINDTSSRYIVQNGYYEGKTYPRYCSGTFFALPMPLVSEVYYAMLDTPYFMPDDAWLGVIWEKLGINIVDTHTHFAGISSYRKELRILKLFTTGKYVDQEIFASILDYAYSHEHIAAKLIEVWFAFKSKEKQIVMLRNEQSGTGYAFNFFIILIVCLFGIKMRKISMPKCLPDTLTVLTSH